MSSPKFRVGQRVGVVSHERTGILADTIVGSYGKVLAVQPPTEHMSQYVYDVKIVGRRSGHPPLTPAFMALPSVPLWETELEAMD